MTKEFLEIQDNNEELESSSYELYNIDIIKLYLREISKFPLLTEEEEKKYGTDLKLYSKISDLISEKTINNHIEPILNIDIILASIKTEEERAYITNILGNYCHTYGRKESEGDKVITYYLQEYNKLCKSLHHIPTPLELTSYFSKPNKYNLFTDFTNVTKLESNELILKISNYVKYMIAKNTMINCNLRLVIGPAKKYSTTDSLELLDRISEGNKGLITAVEKFDVDEGCKFSTYAMWWIMQRITRGISDTDRFIRISVAEQEKQKKFERQYRKLEQTKQRGFSALEISKELNIPIEVVLEYYRRNNLKNIAFLEAPVPTSEKRELPLLDFIPDDKKSTDKDIERLMLQEEIEEALSYLTDREREVIKLRFGFLDGRKYTLDEIGRQYKLTRERIRQIESLALKKLRSPRRSRKLRDFYEDNN